jgi:hypothetical protein
MVEGPLPVNFVKIVAKLAGRKVWFAGKAVSIEASAGNIRMLKEQQEFELDWFDKSGDLGKIEELEKFPTQHANLTVPEFDYNWKHKPWEHQSKAIGLSWDREAYGLFLEMGLGKTAILIANAGILHKQGKLTGVLILSPKGVHRQWVEEQVPEHLDPSIEWERVIWKPGSKYSNIELKMPDRLTFFSMNVDAIRTDAGFKAAKQFFRLHKGKSMMIVDESHLIKNHTASRTKYTVKIGEEATYRRIATGTPIAKNVMDAWSQMMFLNPQILGHKYASSFRARYCTMGGWENKQIVGSKNTEEFYSLIAPHTFRLTKAEALDLPPKIYVTREYEMSDATRQHYNSLKHTFLTSLSNGDIVDVPSAAVALVRLQQVLCGYLPQEEGGIETFSHERIDTLMEIVEQVEGPVLIWARFNEDIRRIVATLEEYDGPGSAVQYVGATSQADRKTNVGRWLAGEARHFVSNPAAGGTGLNLQGGGCQTVIYYSNSFDALHRWQSEDRVHRIGTKGAVTYYDLVATKSLDRMILRNLRDKKALSAMTLDDIRTMLVAS